MTADMRRVYSSNIEMIGHDADAGELHVLWKSGKTSIYSGVPADLAHSVMNSPSVGTRIQREIKPAHQHRYA